MTRQRKYFDIIPTSDYIPENYFFPGRKNLSLNFSSLPWQSSILYRFPVVSGPTYEIGFSSSRELGIKVYIWAQDSRKLIFVYRAISLVQQINFDRMITFRWENLLFRKSEKVQLL